MTCPLQKLTIGTTGYAPFVLQEGIGSNLMCVRSFDDNVSSIDDRSVAGVQIVTGNFNYKSTLKWAIRASIDSKLAAYIEKLIAIWSYSPEIIFYLQDEVRRLSDDLASFRPRTIVPSTTISDGYGSTQSFYSFNVRPVLTNKEVVKNAGKDNFELELNFKEV